MKIEDSYETVMYKAQQGLGMSTSVLSMISGISIKAIRDMRRGQFSEAIVSKVAATLKLSPLALIESFKHKYCPHVSCLKTFRQFSTPFKDMNVNTYLVWDLKTRKAVIFDTGTNLLRLIAVISEQQLEVEAIFITHSHLDHILLLKETQAQTGNPRLYASSLANLDGAEAVEDGNSYNIGDLYIISYLTPGHSLDGAAFYIDGLKYPLAVVGDTVFAGSIASIPAERYTGALKVMREKILSLPGCTILCPGHGSMTTVSQEQKYNSFFA